LKKKGRKKKGKQSIFRYLGYTEARKLIKIRNSMFRSAYRKIFKEPENNFELLYWSHYDKIAQLHRRHPQQHHFAPSKLGLRLRDLLRLKYGQHEAMSQNVQQPNSHLFLKALLLNTVLYQRSKPREWEKQQQDNKKEDDNKLHNITEWSIWLHD